MRARGSLVARPRRAVMRDRSSAAARRPNVSTSTCSGSAPAATRATTASTSVVVLPVPGPASTSSGPPGWATTSCWAGSRTGAPMGAATGRTSRYGDGAAARRARGRGWLVTSAIPPRTLDTTGARQGP